MHRTIHDNPPQALIYIYTLGTREVRESTARLIVIYAGESCDVRGLVDAVAAVVSNEKRFAERLESC